MIMSEHNLNFYIKLTSLDINLRISALTIVLSATMNLFALLQVLFTLNVLAASNITYSTKGSQIQYPVTLNGINLLSASAAELAGALSAGIVTTTQLVNAYIARIEANDHQGRAIQLNHSSLI